VPRRYRDEESANPYARRMTILDIVFSTQGEVRTSDLTARFDIEPNLLAYDLRQLEAMGLVERGYGWVRKRIAAIDDIFVGSEFAARAGRMHEAKESIARHIAEELIDEGTQVVLDAGTTAYAVARHLVELKKDVTLWTNNLPLFLYVLAHSEMVCYLVGGELSRAHAALVGETPDRQIADAKFDLAVVTPKGLMLQELEPAKGGPLGKEIASATGQFREAVCVTLFNEDSAQRCYKQTMVRNANRVAIAADQNKLAAVGQPFLAVVAPSARQVAAGAVRTRGATFAGGGGPVTPNVEVRAPGEVTLVTDALQDILEKRNPDLSETQLAVCCEPQDDKEKKQPDQRPIAIAIV